MRSGIGIPGGEVQESGRTWWWDGWWKRTWEIEIPTRFPLRVGDCTVRLMRDGEIVVERMVRVKVGQVTDLTLKVPAEDE